MIYYTKREKNIHMREYVTLPGAPQSLLSEKSSIDFPMEIEFPWASLTLSAMALSMKKTCTSSYLLYISIITSKHQT